MQPIAHIHTDFPTKFGVPRQSLIAKKLQIESHYCFRGPKTALSAKLPRGTFACIANWCINEVRKTKK